jgi:N-acetylmuramic acid 6-phosphate (MurNAc-6-P) etherase
MELTGLSRRQAQTLLKRADGQLKAAIVMHFRRVDLARAMAILERNDQILRRAIVDDGETA